MSGIFKSYVTKPGRFGRFSLFGKIVGRFIQECFVIYMDLFTFLFGKYWTKLVLKSAKSASYATTWQLSSLTWSWVILRFRIFIFKHFDDLPRLAVTSVFIYRFLAPFLQPCAVLDAHVSTGTMISTGLIIFKLCK
jgi:hypothetical protein